MERQHSNRKLSAILGGASLMSLALSVYASTPESGISTSFAGFLSYLWLFFLFTAVVQFFNKSKAYPSKDESMISDCDHSPGRADLGDPKSMMIYRLDQYDQFNR